MSSGSDGLEHVVTSDGEHGDQALLALYRRGDEAAGNELFSRWWDRLFAFFCKRAPRDEVEDLVAATADAVLRSVQAGAPRCLDALVWQVASHKLVDCYRRQQRQGGRRGAPGRVDGAAVGEALSLVPSDEPSPLEKLLGRERSARFLEALGRLPAADRDLLLACAHGDVPMTCLAALRGVGVDTLYVRIHRARKRLRDELREVGE